MGDVYFEGDDGLVVAVIVVVASVSKSSGSSGSSIGHLASTTKRNAVSYYDL